MGSTAHPLHSLRVWHKQTSFLTTSHLSTGGRQFCGQRLKWPGSKASPKLDVLDWHMKRHLGSDRSCREYVQNSQFNSTPRNVLWEAFPARTNSLSDESQENNTFTHTSSSLLQHLNSSVLRRCQNKRFGFFEVTDCLPWLLSFHWRSFFHYSKCCTSYANSVRTAQCL